MDFKDTALRFGAEAGDSFAYTLQHWTGCTLGITYRGETFDITLDSVAVKDHPEGGGYWTVEGRKWGPEGEEPCEMDEPEHFSAILWEIDELRLH